MQDDTPVETGAIARDFGIPIPSRQVVLSIVGRRATLQAGLFPDAVFVPKDAPADAFLINSPIVNYFSSSRPALRVTSGFLRTPPTPKRLFKINSATLSRIGAGRAQRWPELVMARDSWLTPPTARRAEAVLAQVTAARVGSSCWAATPRHAVAGRVVIFAAADHHATRSMLLHAIKHGAASHTLLVIKQPGGIGATAKRLGVTVLDGSVDPWPIIEQCDRVHAPGGSEAALLAALLGKDVVCLGQGPLSFTQDKVRLAAAVLLLGTRYANPFTGHSISCEVFLDIISEMKIRHDLSRSVACCVGISFWKRRRVAAMLGGARPPAFRKSADAAVRAAAKRGGGVAVWASRVPATLSATAANAKIPVMRLEDGFVRSVGLGADFLPPLSLVLDRLGIYYDATGPSDLERLLSDATFDECLLQRAAALRRRMVMDRVTKYNLPPGRGMIVTSSGRVILVPGQVADDRSVLLGGGGVRPGLDLLRRVRLQAPDAHILYKPHPDVDAGHRQGAVPDAEALRYANQIIRGGSMADLLAMVHEVHTLTSLAGFEALLRDKPVTTYGQPFYSGWGLTTDLNPPARRTRRLHLDELVAGTMILYPHYFDPVTSLACGPEIVLDRLQDPRLHRVSLLVMARRAQGRLFERACRLGGHLQRITAWKEAA